MRSALAFIAAATIILLPASAQARRGKWRNRPPVYLTEQGQWARELYPQYYGGIHARQMQNIGIPNGDIGLRGNGGVTPYPW